MTLDRLGAPTYHPPVGLAEDLDYVFRPPGAIRRLVQAATATPLGSWLSARAAPSFDRFLLRLTGGGTTLTAALAGLPVLMLTTTGARSGIPRSTPVLGIPHAGDLAIIGSGFGQRATPGWVQNLRADPAAEVAFRGRTITVVATVVGDPTEIWSLARSLYPGYGFYPDRASHRQIAVFSLAPRRGGGGDDPQGAR